MLVGAAAAAAAAAAEASIQALSSHSAIRGDNYVA